ncbi:MAG: EamA family transporter [Chloroflexi bacterium]|nr:EamA family transporter [Chloroflexota bacterium]
MTGQIAALVSALTWAASNVVVKTISGTVRPVPVSAVQTCVTAAALLALTAAFGRMD